MPGISFPRPRSPAGGAPSAHGGWGAEGVIGEVRIPETHYARVGEISIAFQVIGDGPFDLVHIPSWITNVEENWNDSGYARFLRRLVSFSRLIVFDKRGTGLSDRVDATQTLEQRIDDLQAVMAAAGSERAALFGSTEGSAMCALFAATYPRRTRALVMYGAYAKRMRSIDYPWAPDEHERQELYDWGGPVTIGCLSPRKLGAFYAWLSGAKFP